MFRATILEPKSGLSNRFVKLRKVFIPVTMLWKTAIHPFADHVLKVRSWWPGAVGMLLIAISVLGLFGGAFTSKRKKNGTLEFSEESITVSQQNKQQHFSLVEIEDLEITLTDLFANPDLPPELFYFTDENYLTFSSGKKRYEYELSIDSYYKFKQLKIIMIALHEQHYPFERTLNPAKRFLGGRRNLLNQFFKDLFDKPGADDLFDA